MEPVMAVHHVSKSFGRVRALANVNLTIRAGERVALVGANGSGKTTLLRAMLGLVRVEGRVMVEGHDVANVPELALRDLAYVPQVAPPLEVPLSELVRAACALRGADTAAVALEMERFGLDLASLAKQRFRDLSGGQKQKILASLALAAHTRMLVCDEPTANLDPVARELFMERLLQRRPDDVLILCSHRLEEVRHLVARVVEMQDGQVVADTPVETAAAPLGSAWVEVCLQTGQPSVLALAAQLKALGLKGEGQDRMRGQLGAAAQAAALPLLLRHSGAAVASFSVNGAQTGLRAVEG